MNKNLQIFLSSRLDELETQRKLYEANPRTSKGTNYSELKTQIRKIKQALGEKVR
jgi:hypothetical protein